MEDVLLIRLLGGFAVSVDGRPVESSRWRLRKAKHLVKMLALAPGRRLHREELAETLWPGLAPEQAFSNLRKALHGARRALQPAVEGPGPYLQWRDDVLALAPAADVWIDVEAFERAGAEARRSRLPSTYQAALELYRGDLLPEDRYEDWSSGRREALREEFLSLLGELAVAYEVHGDLTQAEATLQRLLAADPSREEAHRALMRVYARRGQREQALRQFRALTEGLKREFSVEPDATSQRLYQAIHNGTFSTEPAAESLMPAPVARTPRANLPQPLTSFVGREQDVAEITNKLGRVRLLTLAGPGGVGKTRLALEVASALRADFPHGVWLLDLAPLSDGALIPQAAAAMLDVQTAGRPPLAALIDFLQDRKTLLLMDNCEHLADACEKLTESLLQHCPDLRILATSREPLGVSGEHVYRVAPLTLPEPGRPAAPDVIARSAAVRLFVERAAQAERHFVLTPSNADAVVRICRALDGLPLAIELAAARVSAISPAQIASRLDDQVGLLAGRPRTAHGRHPTLHAAMDWSHNLLSPPEQTLFRQLAVFAGGCTLEAAEGVCGGTGLGADAVLDLMGRLVHRSLVIARTDDGATRYRLLEPIRQYAGARLADAGETEQLRNRHFDWYFNWVHGVLTHEAGHGGPLPGKIRATLLARDHDNLRGALEWAHDARPGDGLRLAVMLWRFWAAHGYMTEGLHRLNHYLAAATDASDDVRAEALLGCGRLAALQGDLEGAREYIGRSRVVAERDGNLLGVARADEELGNVAQRANDHPTARRALEEALRRYRVIGGPEDIGRVLSNLGHGLWHEGDRALARAYSEEGLAMAHAQSSDHSTLEALWTLGLIARDEGDLPAAKEWYARGLELVRDAPVRPDTPHLLEACAGLATQMEDYARAARLLGAASALREILQYPLPESHRGDVEGPLAIIRSALAPDEFARAWREGQSMSALDAVICALDQPTPAGF